MLWLIMPWLGGKHEHRRKPQIQYYTFEDMLAIHGYVVYTCVGVSMMPMLRPRKDIVEIRPLTTRPKKYDVVLYKRKGQYILHRILKVLPDGGYYIAGDHNTFVERDVTDEMILGKMVRVLRNGKDVRLADWRYRLYVHLWCDVYPVRMFLLKCKAFIGAKLLRV